MLCLDLELLFLVLEPPPGRSFIYRLTPGGLQNPGRLINVSGSVSTLSYLTTQVIRLMAVYILGNPPLGFGPSYHEHNQAPPGRFILNSYIPNIRPQVDLNLFMSIFNT